MLRCLHFTYKCVVISLLVTELFDKTSLFYFATFGLIPTFYELWTEMECNYKN